MFLGAGMLDKNDFTDGGSIEDSNFLLLFRSFSSSMSSSSSSSVDFGKGMTGGLNCTIFFLCCSSIWDLGLGREEKREGLSPNFDGGCLG